MNGHHKDLEKKEKSLSIESTENGHQEKPQKKESLLHKAPSSSEEEEIKRTLPEEEEDEGFSSLPNTASWRNLSSDKVREMVPVTSSKPSPKKPPSLSKKRPDEKTPLLKDKKGSGNLLTGNRYSIQYEEEEEDEIIPVSSEEEDEEGVLKKVVKIYPDLTSKGCLSCLKRAPKVTYILETKGGIPTLLAFLPEAAIDDDHHHHSHATEMKGILEDDDEIGPSSVVSALLEEGHGLTPGQKLTLSTLLTDFDNLPPQVKAYLQRLTSSDLEGHISKSDIAAYILGTTLALFVTYAMGPVFNGGVDYMKNEHGWNFIKIFNNGKQFYEVPDFYYITATLLPHYIAQDVSFFKQLFTFLKENADFKGRTGWTLVAVFLPSSTEPGYLFTFEIYAMNKMGVHGWNNQFAIISLLLGPPLFANSLMENFDAAWEMTDEFLEWIQTHRDTLPQWLPTWASQKISRWFPDDRSPFLNQFLPSLDKLPFFFQYCPEDMLNTIYNTVTKAKQTLKSQFPQLKGDDLDTATGFFITRYLLEMGENLKNGVKRAQTWMDTLVEYGTYLTLFLGSPYRLLVPQVIVRTLIHLFASPYASDVAGWIGAGLAFLPQTALEYKGMRSLTTEVLQEDTPSGHASHPCARGGATGASLWQAGVFTVPLMVLAWQATDLWLGSDRWMLMAIPYLLAEFAQLATQFHKTYNTKVATATIKGSVFCCATCKSKGQPCTDCKRDQLIRLTKHIRKKLPRRPVAYLQKLEEVLNLGNDTSEDVEDSSEED